MSISITIEFDESQLAKLMQIPLHLRLAPAERVLKAMAKPVVEKGKAIAPSSRTSGTRKKMGKNVTKHFVGKDANTKHDSGRHIGTKYLKNNRGGLMIIGGIHPKANKLNFDSGKPRKVFYWGKDAGKVKRINPKDRFMQRAYDETRAEQLSAGNRQLEIELKELKLG